MPYDPSKPVNGSPIVAAELRNQFAGLANLIDTKAEAAALVPTIVENSSGNADNVNALNLAVSDPPTQAEVQTIASKVDEILMRLKRQ